MNPFSLPLDDLPPTQTTPLDRLLHSRLETAANEYFYQACDRITQSVLNRCQWRLMASAHKLTLAIFCEDTKTYWCVLSDAPQLASAISRLIDRATIQINAPNQTERSIEIRVEISY